MNRVYILDEDDTPQRFPLVLLFARVLLAIGPRSSESWLITMARGYGQRITRIESELDDVDEVDFAGLDAGR